MCGPGNEICGEDVAGAETTETPRMLEYYERDFCVVDQIPFVTASEAS